MSANTMTTPERARYLADYFGHLVEVWQAAMEAEPLDRVALLLARERVGRDLLHASDEIVIALRDLSELLNDTRRVS